MDNDTTTGITAALYNRVLSGRFIPGSHDLDQPLDAIEDTQTHQSDRKAAKAHVNTSDTVPELKTVIQFKDPKGKRNVIEFQSYSFNAAEEAEEGEQIEEEDPFADFPILLKAVIGEGRSLTWRLEIQCRGIVEIFREIARNHVELDLTAEVLIIEHPFRCLFFLREEIERHSILDGIDKPTRIGLVQLLRFIKSPMCHEREIETYENQVIKHGTISFFMLWMIFRPYEPIIRVRPNQSIEDSQCFILQSIKPEYSGGRMSTPVWELSLLFGSHDGNHFNIKNKTKNIGYFDGFRQITDHSMRFVPLRMLEEKAQTSIRSALINRGKAYIRMCRKQYTVWKLDGPAYLLNSGKGDELRQMQAKKVIDLNERVIVDRTKQNSIGEVNDDRGREVSHCLRHALPSAPAKTKKKSGPRQKKMAGVSGAASLIPDDWTQTNNDWGSSIDPAAYTKPKQPDLEDDDYLICRNVTTAFALKQKIWVKMVKVNHLSEIQYTEDPFRSLQMPAPKKQFIRRLVEGFRKSKDGTYDDVIEGKGRGLIFLLYGPPGLGKTLTAESVAEVAKRPLYHISAGELSTNVSSLESELQIIFKMGARWDAVVLLDEADVLMSQRTTDNLERNSVVAVFLRMLEYYRGMLFLTTNRRDDFDDAFFNRIHVTIEYSELDAISRTNIWRHHLQRATRDNSSTNEGGAIAVQGKKSATWTEEMYTTLGRIPLNGRDIKNYVRVAYTYAHAVDDEDLGIEQVRAVLQNSLSAPVSASQRKLLQDGGWDNQEHALLELDDLVNSLAISNESTTRN